MFRAPICRQSATAATASTSPGARTSVTTGRPLTARASASISSPSPPIPRNVYGEVLGLNAPPRRAAPPAARTARAVSSVTSRDSTAHGPAITARGWPWPTGTSPIRTTVSSPMTSRDASLNGRLMGTTSATPGNDSTASAAAREVLPNVPIAVRSAPGSGTGVMPNSLMRSTTASISSLVASRFMTTSTTAPQEARRRGDRPPTRDEARGRRAERRGGPRSAFSECSTR